MSIETQVPQFEVIARFQGRGSAPARMVGPGPDGTERLYVNYFYHSTTDLVAYHPDSDRYDVWTSPEGGAWAMEASPQGDLYLGTFHAGHVLKLDVRASELIDLGIAVPGDGFIWCLSLGPDGMLYGGTSSTAHLIRVDPATDAIADLGRIDDTELYLRSICAAADGWVYCGIGCGKADFVAYNPYTGEKRNLLPSEERADNFPTLFRGEDGYAYGSYRDKHYRLRDGGIEQIDELPPAEDRLRWRDGRKAEEPDTYPGSNMVIHRVGEGPDGNIYASSIQPNYLLRYDPATGEAVNLGLMPGAEVYSFLSAYGRLFIASYTHSTLQIYDPGKPFDPGVQKAPSPPDAERGKNPANYGPVAPRQMRPYDMVLGADGKVYIGSVSGYGFLDGVIAWYDPKTDTVDYVSNPIIDQSVTALCALPDGKLVVASALVGGGVAVEPVDATLFLWDPVEKAMVNEPVIPAPGESEVNNLTLGGDGLLYGSARQQLFVADPQTMHILATAPSPMSHVRRAGMLTLEDGRIIALCGPSATVVRYAHGALRFEEFARFDDGWPWVGKAVAGGYLYAASSTKLIRCKIPERKPR